jgi:hypothetical protein
MKKEEGIQRWLAIVIIIIIIAILVAVILLPILIEKLKASNDSDFIIDLQIGNPVAILSLPSRLTEFKQSRELVQVSLLGAPFISQSGQTMIAVKDLETFFPGKVEWNSENRTIKVSIPSGIISKSQLVFTLTDKDFILRNNRAFIPVRTMATLLKVSEIIWSSETQGIRIIWYW